jgi:hypothetical protein
MMSSYKRDVKVIATAFHGVGHVVVALQVEYIIFGMLVSFDQPSDGFTIRNKSKMFNPNYPDSTPESVSSDRNNALENIRKEMKISLAEPIAKARFFGSEPLRLRGFDEVRLNC